MAVDPSGYQNLSYPIQVLLVSLISTTFAGDASFVKLFFSLTTDINQAYQNPRVPAAQRDVIGPGVRLRYFFASGCLSIPFVSSQWLL